MSSGRRVAQFLFWGLLLLSMAFNAVVAFLVPSDTNPYVVALVHACYPAMFAVSETLLVRVPKLRHWFPDVIRIVFATGSALAAVAGSAQNLAHLAEITGAEGWLKWSLPVVLDLPTCLAMLSTVYAADAEADTSAAEAPAAVERTGGERSTMGTGTQTPQLRSRTVQTAASPKAGSAKPSRSSASGPVKKQPAKSGSLSDDVAAALRVDSSLTAKVLAERFGVSTKTIGRTTAWKNRKNMEGAAA